MAASHLFTVATVWHDEPIKICVHPPTGARVREYVVSRGRCPSGAPTQILGGEAVSQSSPRGPQQQFHLVLWDLDDVQLGQVMEELQQETARRRRDCIPTWVTLGSAAEPCREDLILIWLMAKWPFKRGWWLSKLVQQPGRPPSKRGGCWSPPQHIHS